MTQNVSREEICFSGNKIPNILSIQNTYSRNSFAHELPAKQEERDELIQSVISITVYLGLRLNGISLFL